MEEVYMKIPLSWITILLFTLIISPVATRAADDPGLVRKAARDGYVFLYPLVMNYRLMERQAINGGSPSFAGGFGKWTHYGPAASELGDYTSPGVDTLYSASWVDLRSEPWVLIVPPSGNNRYVASQWDDLWGYVLDCPGTILDGEKGGAFLLAPPGWKGKLPKGIRRVIRGESPFLGTLTRTEVMSPADLPAASALRQGFELKKLSSFLGSGPPDPAPEVSWPAWKEGSEGTPDFFGYACFLLTFTDPHPEDRVMLRRLAEIGVSPGAAWKPAQKGQDFMKALQDGVNDARKEISRASLSTAWSNRLYSNRQTLRGDYLSRCLGAYAHLFGNVPSQTMYLFLERDTQGKPLDGGRHSYTVTFPRGGTPPDRFFWSLTAYTLPGRALLQDSPLDRHAIGTHSLKLHKGADGSITLFLQKASPGKDRELNWLPVPAGPFSLVVRACGPSRDLIFHAWKVPGIRRER
jgi:hypothetical protein